PVMVLFSWLAGVTALNAQHSKTSSDKPAVSARLPIALPHQRLLDAQEHLARQFAKSRAAMADLALLLEKMPDAGERAKAEVLKKLLRQSRDQALEVEVRFGMVLKHMQAVNFSRQFLALGEATLQNERIRLAVRSWRKACPATPRPSISPT